MLRDDVEEDIGDETFLAGDGLTGPVCGAGVLHAFATCFEEGVYGLEAFETEECAHQGEGLSEGDGYVVVLEGVVVVTGWGWGWG